MGWFDVSITDVIVAVANVGVSGAAWKVAVDELPKWRGRRDSEASDREARTLLEKSHLLKSVASEVTGHAINAMFARYEEVLGQDANEPLGFRNPNNRSSEADSGYLSLLGTLEVCELFWPGEMKGKKDAIVGAYSNLVADLSIFYKAAGDTDLNEIGRVVQLVQGMDRIHWSGAPIVPSLIELIRAIDDVRPVIREKIFGRGLRK